MKPKLLITRKLPEKVIARAERGFDVVARPSTRPLSREEAVAAFQAHDAILPTLGDPFDAETFIRASPVTTRILANFGVGYDHIDAVAARRAGIVVTHTPGAVTDATADIAMTLLLMAARRAGEGERLVRSGRWEGWHPVQLLGRHVTGRTLGIIGMGRIGRAVARRGHFGFGMDVVFFNRSPILDSGIPGARQLESIGTVMEEADFVVVAVTGGRANRHLVGAAEIARMKPEGVLVNISRGEVIDEAALIEALEARHIFAAGLDVYEHEPEVPERLRKLENAVLLPHLGTATGEVREAMGMMALDNLEAFFAGRPVPNPVPEMQG